MKQKRFGPLAEDMAGVSQQVLTAKTTAEKVAILHQYSSPEFKDILGLAFDPRIKFLLPKGKPPYRQLGHEFEGHNVLRFSLNKKKFKYYIKGAGYDGLKPHKRERMFVELLETLDPLDAEMVSVVKDKKWPWKGVTDELVRLAFPNLTKEWPMVALPPLDANADVKTHFQGLGGDADAVVADMAPPAKVAPAAKVKAKGKAGKKK